jgi:hypothetical protein
MTNLYYPSNVERYRSIANKYSKLHAVPVDVILATIKKESAGNPKAFNGQNNENSRGLMQMSEATATTHPAVNVPFMILDKLYEPDYNIDKGTSLLKWIYDYLTPYFNKSMDEKLKWKLVTSSYNQGHGYWKWALQTTAENNEAFTWENILHNVLNPTKTTRTPWVDSAKTYGPSIVEPIADIFLKKISNPMDFFNQPIIGSELTGTNSSSSFSSVIPFILGLGVLGGAGFYFMKKGKK